MTVFGPDVDSIVGARGVQAFNTLKTAMPYCKARDSTIMACIIGSLKSANTRLEVPTEVIHALRCGSELTDISEVTRMAGRVRRYLVSSGAPVSHVTAEYMCKLLNPYLETPKSRVLGIQYKCDTSMYPTAVDVKFLPQPQHKVAVSSTFTAPLEHKRMRQSHTTAVQSMMTASDMDQLTMDVVQSTSSRSHNLRLGAHS